MPAGDATFSWMFFSLSLVYATFSLAQILLKAPGLMDDSCLQGVGPKDIYLGFAWLSPTS